MGLFSNTIIDRGLASLFGKKATREDLVEKKSTDQVESSPAPVPEANAKPTPESAPESAPKPESESESELEDQYVKKRARMETEETEESEKTEKPEEPEGNDEKDDSEQETTEETKGQKPERRSQQENDEHTVFIKNVPNAVLTDRKALREFKKLFGPEIQSVRFRSIAMSEVVPRKVAYIKQKLHPARDAVNCYIVYKQKSQMFETLQTKNGVEFMDHHLFVDSASKPREQVAKRSVFIGNLSFEATEEQLYRQFADCGGIENLRIVRDRKFNVGKGFAYIQFDDVSTVQLALLKNGQDFEGRPLRVTRCSSKEAKKSHKNNTGSYKEKQTDRSRKGDPKKQRALARQQQRPEIMEGERAKEGDSVPLGRKRKDRKGQDGRRPNKKPRK